MNNNTLKEDCKKTDYPDLEKLPDHKKLKLLQKEIELTILKIQFEKLKFNILTKY